MINFKNYIKGNKAFIPFVTAGDPSLDKTEEFLHELIKAGSSIIEVGIPFSDPIAEGNTIMEADIRALSAGTTLDKIFKNNPNFNQIIVRWWNWIDNLNAMKKVIDDWKYSIQWSSLETREWSGKIKWTSWSQNEYIINKPEKLINKETWKEVDFEKMLDKKYDIDWCNSLSL